MYVANYCYGLIIILAAIATAVGASSVLGKQSAGDHYQFRHVVFEGFQDALNECREGFKWDRWNCPKKTFHDILQHLQIPSNKEVAFVRSMMSASTVLALDRACSLGKNYSICGCSQSTRSPEIIYHTASRQLSESTLASLNLNQTALQAAPDIDPETLAELSSGRGRPAFRRPQADHWYVYGENNNHVYQADQNQADQTQDTPQVSVIARPEGSSNKFVWGGCDETVSSAFAVSKTYLDGQDIDSDQTIRRINAKNYEAGRIAVRKLMKKICKCHGISGSCQLSTCWTSMPTMAQVRDYLKQQYRLAAKVGASTAEETEISSLNKELKNIRPEKLVFAEASPDYCYENTVLGINGTLGRYCSMNRFRPDGSKTSKSELGSCDRLCTKCGYKIKTEEIQVESQCDCRFIFCCKVECRKCTHTERVYKCARHA